MPTISRAALVLTTLAACAVEPVETSELAQELACPPPTLDTTKSLLVTESQTLAKFGFQRLLTQIATSGGATNTPTAIFQAWMNTFNDCNDARVDPNHFGIACRPEITTLANIDPFGSGGFFPTAIVNRFDLAPTSGANCGEYRVIFSMPRNTQQVERGFLIFEARLPNPRPDLGLAGCAPVANFWAGLSSATAAQRATRLENFYFNGLTAGGETFEPVVAASHYGLAVAGGEHAVGQIRTNMQSLASGLWQLREFKLKKPCAATAACALAVQHVSVKENPANELFAGSDAQSTAFQTSFLKQLPALSAGSAAEIAMTTPGNANEWESTSSPPPLGNGSTIYTSFASTAFRNQIAAQLAGGLSVDNILDRANSQTCAGCHKLSDGANLGGGLIWPSANFVQVDEQSTPSQLLSQEFLPFRAAVLTAFLRAQCGGSLPADNGLTLGGGALDAPN